MRKNNEKIKRLFVLALVTSLSALEAQVTVPDVAATPDQVEFQQQAHARLEVTPLDLKEAADVSQNWLNLLDQGKYGESWDAASNIFRYTLKREEWIKAATKLRQPLGRVLSRQLMNEQPKKNPAGLPEGLYMLMAYKTAFQNRPDGIELVTLVWSTDNTWKVLSYEGADRPRLNNP